MRVLNLAVFMMLAAGVGCVRVDQTLTLNEDGSGSLHVAYSVSEQAVAQFRAMQKLTRQMALAAGRPSALSPTDERAYLFLDPGEQALSRELAKYKEYGVVVDDLEVDTRNARRNVRMQLRFRSLERLAQAEVFKDYGFSLYRGPKRHFVFDRPAKDGGARSSMDFSAPEMVRLLTPLLSGFRVVTKVRTPGAILRTNAHSHSQHVATWNFDFDKDPNALIALQRQRMLILFDGDGLELPAVRLEPDA